MEPWGMHEVLDSLLSGKAKVVGTNCPRAAAFLREVIAEKGLDATVKLDESSLPPDLPPTYPYQN